MPEERLQKILAFAGIASRRKAEQYILEGRVTVNGQIVSELGSKADPDRDHIKVDGKLLRQPKRLIGRVLAERLFCSVSAERLFGHRAASGVILRSSVRVPTVHESGGSSAIHRLPTFWWSLCFSQS